VSPLLSSSLPIPAAKQDFATALHPIQSQRITKTEQVSKSRFHNEVKLASPSDVDEELLGWLKDAYRLG
jgi:uncharacterized protein DUF5655